MVRSHQPGSFRFSTDGLPARDRVKAVRELRDRRMLPIEPLPGRHVHLDIATWFLPHLGAPLVRDGRLAASSISVIAYEVGFGDLSYFNRVFRRHFGRTPSEVKNGD